MATATSARIHEELPKVQEQQHVLLERLRRFGVLAMIEEMTEEKFPLLLGDRERLLFLFLNHLQIFGGQVGKKSKGTCARKSGVLKFNILNLKRVDGMRPYGSWL